MKKTENYNRAKFIRQSIFAAAILILPIAWWAFSFLFTTTDTIILGFKQWDIEGEKFYYCGFSNFIKVISEMTTDGGILNIAFRNSILIWSIHTFFTLPVTILVSYSIHKKVMGAGVFKVILFLPSIVSGMVWTIIYKFLIDYGFPTIMGVDPTTASSLLQKEPYDLILLITYTQWLGFAGNMVIYTGAMSRVPPSLVEAGQLDGLTDFKELIYIVLPLIFPTLSVVLTTAVIGIFTSSLPTYQFFGESTADHLYTFGFYTFLKGLNQKYTETPMVSALSMIVCLMATPFTLGTRWLLEKFGPTVEY